MKELEKERESSEGIGERICVNVLCIFGSDLKVLYISC